MIFLANLSGESLNLFLGGVFGMLVLSGALVVFFIVYQRRIFAQIREREANDKIYQKALLAAAVEVQELERRRIAGDLHDEIGGLLTATRLYLRQLDPVAGTARIAAIREQSLTILDEMIQSTRRITHDLLPPVLEKFGFQAAAEDLCEWIDKSGDLTVHFFALTEERMVPKRELALYRVLQELLNNTLKHAGATTIDVTIKQRRNEFTFTYKDDGCGFDPQKTDYDGLGLRNIESRVALENGVLESITSPGGGLRVAINFPVGIP